MATEKRVSTKASGLILAGIAIAAVAAVYVVIFVPGVLENLAFLLFAAAVAIVAVVFVIALIAGILAIPFYMSKGETYQTDVSYELKDVESIGEKSSEDGSEKKE